MLPSHGMPQLNHVKGRFPSCRRAGLSPLESQGVPVTIPGPRRNRSPRPGTAPRPDAAGTRLGDQADGALAGPTDSHHVPRRQQVSDDHRRDLDTREGISLGDGVWVVRMDGMLPAKPIPVSPPRYQTSQLLTSAEGSGEGREGPRLIV